MSTEQDPPAPSRADRLKAYRFQPGQSGNPGGKPKGYVPPVKVPGAPPSRADHLKPHRWEPGQSGNPRGRPPKRKPATTPDQTDNTE